MERHPEFFDEAKRYEKTAIDHGSPFTWSQGESLEDMARAERVVQIKEDHERRLRRQRATSQANPLRPDAEPLDIDDLYGQAKVCLACHQLAPHGTSLGEGPPNRTNHLANHAEGSAAVSPCCLGACEGGSRANTSECPGTRLT